jgi:uncharacterized protein
MKIPSKYMKNIIFFAFFITPLICYADELSSKGKSLFFSQQEIQELEKQANNRDGEAAYKLSQYYDYIMVDPKKGECWEVKAAEDGNISAQYGMGIRYVYDPQIRNIDNAIFWFKKAAENGGNSPAQDFLNHLFSPGELEELKKRANAGEAEACSKLQGYFQYIENDYAQARYWFNFYLKNKYYHKDVNRDLPKQSFYLSHEQIRGYINKAERGDGIAASRLSFYYEQVGYFSKSFYWLKKAADNGDDGEQYNLGSMYLYDDKIKNKEKALFWYKKAAEQGNTDAKEKLSKFLSDNDIEKLSGLSNAGDPDAAFRLYEYYSQIDYDSEKAKLWLGVAAKNGYPRAQKMKERGL